MKKLILICVGIILIVGIYMIIPKADTITNHPSSGSSIVMFGDSLTYGIGSTDGNNLPSLLSKKINMPVINMGVSGDTTADGLSRIDSVIEKNPKVVIVLFGGNDFLRGVPITQTFENIDTIVASLQNAGAVVVLVGIQGGLLSDPYKVQFEKIRDERHTLYVPSILSGIITRDNLMSDQIHPNDKGYAIMADKIYPILKKGL